MYNGQGLGNQLCCYITSRVIALDKGYAFGLMSPEKFKGNDFLSIEYGAEVIGGYGTEGGPPEKLPEGIFHYYKERKITHPVYGSDISSFDTNLVNIPDCTKIDGIMQDEQYYVHRKSEIRQWLKVRSSFECYDYSDNNVCVINFRGGDYVDMRNVFLPAKYWEDAIRHMKSINKDISFVVITDDVKVARKFFPKYEVFHFSIARDYVIIKNAKYLILSNSSFAIFPAWLNDDVNCCIAPKYWWAHKINKGYWACSYNIIAGWLYLDCEGKLHDYDSCLAEQKEYVAQHKVYYQPAEIVKNHLVISSDNADVSWVPERTDNYSIYCKKNAQVHSYTIELKKVIDVPDIGYNIYAYLTFIIDNFFQLPECLILVNGNVLDKYVPSAYFDRISNNQSFTSIVDFKSHKTRLPFSFISGDGCYYEINNDWYLAPYSTRYFHSYNEFMLHFYKDPVLPKYIGFSPGANYVVPKENILKYSKAFYEEIRHIISYCDKPGEAHIVERALQTVWTCNYEINENLSCSYSLDAGIENSCAKPSPKNLFIKKLYRSIVKRVGGMNSNYMLDN